MAIKVGVKFLSLSIGKALWLGRAPLRGNELPVAGGVQERLDATTSRRILAEGLRDLDQVACKLLWALRV